MTGTSLLLSIVDVFTIGEKRCQAAMFSTHQTKLSIELGLSLREWGASC